MGRAVAERLAASGDTVVVIEYDRDALDWLRQVATPDRLVAVVGDAGDEEVVTRAADLAERAGPLTGWVNNAAVFRDASVHSPPAAEVLAALKAGSDRTYESSAGIPTGVPAP